MTTAIDTNILVALWDTDPQLNSALHKALDSAQARGALVITGAVYAELLGVLSAGLRSSKINEEILNADI